jgi:hypothetical protein
MTAAQTQTQELISRNLDRIAADGGKFTAEQFEALDAAQRRTWVATWRRIEREAASEARETSRMNAEAPYSMMQTGW